MWCWLRWKNWYPRIYRTVYRHNGLTDDERKRAQREYHGFSQKFENCLARLKRSITLAWTQWPSWSVRWRESSVLGLNGCRTMEWSCVIGCWSVEASSHFYRTTQNTIWFPHGSSEKSSESRQDQPTKGVVIRVGRRSQVARRRVKSKGLNRRPSSSNSKVIQCRLRNYPLARSIIGCDPSLLSSHTFLYVLAQRHDINHCVHMCNLCAVKSSVHWQANIPWLCSHDLCVMDLGLLLSIPLHERSWWRRWRWWYGVQCAPFL